MKARSARHSQQLLARTAWVGVALMVAIVASSAYLRLTSMGVGCEPWPACYGRVGAAAASGIDLGTASGIARLLHRVSAMAVAFVAAFVLLVALTRPARTFGNVVTAVGLCLCTALLAIVGRQSAGSLIPLVGLVNLIGGFGMLVLFGLLWALNREGAPAGLPVAARPVAFTLIGLAMAQIALGALVSVTYSAPACSGLIACEAPAEGMTAALAAFQPSAPLTIDDAGRVLAPIGASSLQWLHRVLGWLLGAGLALGGVLLAVLGRRRRLGAWIALLAACVAAVGTLMVISAYPLPAVMAHNLCAAALLFSLIVASVRARRVRAAHD